MKSHAHEIGRFGVALALAWSAVGAADNDDGRERFTREVIAALERKDAVAMALLVRFPLKVNLPDSTTILIADEYTLKQRFDQVFPPAFRKYVLDTEKAGSGENGWAGSGYMLEHGAIWAQNYREDEGPPGMRIETVNAGMGVPEQSRAETLFACETSRHRIVIDGKRGALRYRAWNTPHFLPDPPDLSLNKGEESWSGSGPCGHATWKFNKGGTAISVDETGCGPGPGRADVTVTILGDEKQSLACF